MPQRLSAGQRGPLVHLSRRLRAEPDAAALTSICRSVRRSSCMPKSAHETCSFEDRCTSAQPSRHTRSISLVASRRGAPLAREPCSRRGSRSDECPTNVCRVYSGLKPHNSLLASAAPLDRFPARAWIGAGPSAPDCATRRDSDVRLPPPRSGSVPTPPQPPTPAPVGRGGHCTAAARGTYTPAQPIDSAHF